MDSKTFTFVSFNCKNVKRSVDSIRELCRTSDIVALQETWLYPDEIPYLNTIDQEFSYTGTSAVDTSAGILVGRPHGGVAILWRSAQFSNVTVLSTDNPRICAVKIEKYDKPIVIMCVYMPTNCSENMPDFINCLGTVSAIIEDCEIESVYIMGDFNAHPHKLFFNELMEYCIEQKLCCIDVQVLGILSDTCTFISEAYGTSSWLDHCIITQSVVPSVRNVFVKHIITSSDHFPIVLECNLSVISPRSIYQPPNINKSIWGERSCEQIALYMDECNNKLRLIDFPIELATCADTYCTLESHKNVIDKMYSKLILILKQSSAIGRGVRKRGDKKRVEGWNMHVSEAHRVAKIKFQSWMTYGRPTYGNCYTEMRESRKIFKSRLKWCQDHKHQIKMDLIASHHTKKDFRAFWKTTNKIKDRPGLPRCVGGMNNSKDIANLFKNHFHIKSPLGPSCDEVGAEKIRDEIEDRITAKNVYEALKSISRGKSPGHDGLSIEHLQYAGPHISRILAMLYTFCIRHSYMPTDLMRTIVIPVVKNKTGDMSDKNNYRPISMATIVAKVFDSVLNTKLKRYLKLHNNQFGFISGLSTDSTILCLKHTVKYYMDRNTPVYGCFLDLSRAFDMVSYDILWKKLIDIKLPTELIHIFKYWYTNQTSCVKWANTLSKPYRLECGVRQGGLSSPALFNLYVNGLIEELSSMHVGCYVDDVCVNNLSYADDMVLLSASICGIRKLMSVCEVYADSHGLKYNVQKSQFMVFGARCDCINNMPPINLNGAPLLRVDKFKYLGHMITSDLKDDTDIERERRAVSVRANMIARRFARCSREVKITLFRAYCTSLYTCSLWQDYTKRSFRALRIQYNNAFRVLLGLPRFCSASGMFAEARVDDFFANMRKRAASLVSRVRASPNSILRMIGERPYCPYLQHCCDQHAPGCRNVR